MHRIEITESNLAVLSGGVDYDWRSQRMDMKISIYGVDRDTFLDIERYITQAYSAELDVEINATEIVLSGLDDYPATAVGNSDGG